MIDPNKDVNEVLRDRLAAAERLRDPRGGSPKNFYLQAQPTLWEVYGIPKGGNDYFIQITTDSVVWVDCPGRRRPKRQLGQGESGRAADTVVAYCDSTIAFPAVLRVRDRLAQRPPSR